MRGPRAGGDVLLRVLGLAGITLLVVFLALPLLGLLLHVSPAALANRLTDRVVLDALRLSLVTSALATVIVVALGTPLAWLLASRRFPMQRALEVLIDLPMVLPPTVAGFALLMAFGRSGLLGHAFGALGFSIPFTTLAVVIAQVFMAAPFFIGAARAGFAGIDPGLLEAAATLRASEPYRFFRVVLPLARPSLVAGGAMSCARALGEFGATITFAGNQQGTTQTMPLAVYVAMQSDLDTAIVLSVVLLLMSIGLLWGLRSAPGGLMLWSTSRERAAR